VEATARGFLLALTNFDAATIDRGVEEIRSYAVGDFRPGGPGDLQP
jgi:hypothetical protein